MNTHNKRFRQRTLLVMLGLAFTAHGVRALTPFQVSDIRIEGLQRVEPGTVFASMPLHIGDTYTDEIASSAIASLYALGLFKDVRLQVTDRVLVVTVEERPTIAEVNFVGAREFDKDVLKKALRDVGLTEGRPYDKSLTDRAEQELKRQYINRSLYGADVVTTLSPADRNRVNLTFTMSEGELAKIKDIHFVGNKVFSESTLRDLFDLNTGNWLSWYTKTDHYSRSKLNADLETLRSYYLARGYLEFNVVSTQVAISPNKQDISITVNVSEGERYVVSGVQLEGNYLDRENEFKSLVTIQPGEAYNADRLTETNKAFTDYFGQFGYAFARVEARPEIDRERNLVKFVLVADPGRRAYVRRINVTGNTRTRDEVVRREFRQFESSWFDGDRIRRSRDRVDRLGYFKEVNVETEEIPGLPDQVDVTVSVTEKPTGSLQIGAGFSNYEKLALNFGITQDNVFGSGNYLGLNISTSRYNQVYVLSTTDPYYTADGVSRTIDLYHRASKPYLNLGGNYQLATEGGGVRFGVPFSELDRVYFGLGLERTIIKPGTNIPAAYLAYADRYGYTSHMVPFTIGWARDGRDSALAPTRGLLQKFTNETGVAGDVRFMRTSYQYQQYLPLSKQFTLALNAEMGLGKALHGDMYPVFKNFYAGGLGTVRGYEQGSLGPRDVTGAVLGGSKKFNMNAELNVPFPGAGNDRSLRVFGFYDLGNVFGETEKVQFSQMRNSTGLGLSWISPMGPLRLAIANPIRKFAGDRIQRLQFQVGTSF